MPKPGQAQRREAVIFVDEYGNEHNALVTNEFGDPSRPEAPMAINVAYCDPSDGATDQYGVQLVRKSSVVHESQQSAHGMYWKWPE